MTTEKPRTLEEIAAWYWDYGREQESPRKEMNLALREAYALGAASRASPEATPVDHGDRQFLAAVRREIPSWESRALELIALRASPEEGRAAPPPLCTGGGTINAAFLSMATSIPAEGTCGICRQTVPLMFDGTTIAPHGWRSPPAPTETREPTITRVAAAKIAHEAYRAGVAWLAWSPPPAPPTEDEGAREAMKCSACGIKIVDRFTWTFDGRTFCPACTPIGAPASSKEGGR